MYGRPSPEQLAEWAEAAAISEADLYADAEFEEAGFQICDLDDIEFPGEEDDDIDF